MAAAADGLPRSAQDGQGHHPEQLSDLDHRLRGLRLGWRPHGAESLEVRKAPLQRAPAQLLLEPNLPNPHARRTDEIQVRLHLLAWAFAADLSGEAV